MPVFVILNQFPVSSAYNGTGIASLISVVWIMPDKLVSMLVRFLEQNGGTLSKRTKVNEFPELKDDEVEKIESAFQDIFEI